MIDPIATIEQAIVRRLRAHNDEAGRGVPGAWAFTCKYIDGYGGQFETPEEVAQAASRAPGLWAAYEGETGRLENFSHFCRINFVVFALARNFNAEELRLGGRGVVGLYQLIEAARLALAGQTLGLDMEPLELQAVTPLWRGGPQGSGFSLAALRFSTETSVPVESHLEWDGPLCPEPVGLVHFTHGRHELAKSYWRIKDEFPTAETETRPAGNGPEPDPSGPAAA